MSKTTEVLATQCFFTELRVDLSCVAGTFRSAAESQATRKEIASRIFRKYQNLLSPNLNRFVLNVVIGPTEPGYTKTEECRYVRAKWLKCLNRGRCKECGKTLAKDKPKHMAGSSLLVPYLRDYCSQGCTARAELTLRRRSQSCLDRYGVPWAPMSKEVQKTARENYERTHGFTSPNRNPKVRFKIRKTCLAKYGVTCSFQDPGVMAKSLETIKRRYGVPNVMKNRRVFDKNVLSRNSVKTCTVRGVTFRGLQGYEPQALRYLVQAEGVDPKLIHTGAKRIGSFTYQGESSTRTYYPDMFIPGSPGTYLEVKSLWTARDSCKPNIKRKLKAVTKAGFDVRLMVMSGKGDLILDRTWLAER